MSETDDIAERGLAVRVAAVIAVHVVLAPLLVLLGIREAINWAAVDRRWSTAIITLAERIESWGRGRYRPCEGTIITKKSAGGA